MKSNSEGKKEIQSKEKAVQAFLQGSDIPVRWESQMGTPGRKTLTFGLSLWLSW